MTLAALAACSGDTPTQVEFQVIEETDFAPSLGIDLASMTLTGTGVYWKDLTVGTGDAATFGTTPFVTYTGWLADGTQFDSGSFGFLMGNNQVVGGFEDGLLNAKVGGTRLMVIPPNRGYGGQVRYDRAGNVSIPGGSILIFEVTVDSVRPAVGG
jgi:FKBP-type peptidyl-prolyl cis-trans isomerase FkpA